MKRKDIIPALADLTQDIAGPIPVDLVRAWAMSDGSKTSHDRLLEPYKRTGTIVSSDSSGLSKMSQGKPLAHVMKLVSEPKEIIFQYGKAIGGEAVGIWAADNTQMFYPDPIDVNDVVKQMVAAQQSIKGVTVDVGIGIHHGTVYHLAGGLYGKDADYIEDFTEDESEANHILISPKVKRMLKTPFTQMEPYQHMYALTYQDLEVRAKRSKAVRYPAPFSKRFHDAILRLEAHRSVHVRRLQRAFAVRKTVILVRVFHEHESKLLEAFLQQSYVNTTLHDVASKHHVDHIKSNGVLGIYTAKRAKDALLFAKEVRSRIANAQYNVNVGIATGYIMEFALDQGGMDIAGGPVNIASKLAEDTDDRGFLFADTSVGRLARKDQTLKPFEKQISGITIEAWRG